MNNPTSAQEAIVGAIEEMFQTSPFEPLMHHFKKACECVKLIPPLMEATRNGEHEQLKELARQVFVCEHDADIIKDEIRQSIPRTFFLPVYRGDLLGYLKLQDNMADEVEDLAILLTIKKLTIPPQLVDEVFAYVDTVLQVVDKARQMNEQVVELARQGFHSEAAGPIFEMIRAVEKAEWEADKAQYALSQSLFALEDEMKPSDLMLWWRIFLEFGRLANHAENLADRLRRMLSQ